MTPDAYGLYHLKPVQSRPKKFFTIVGMAIVWNALTGLAIYAVVTQWKGGVQYLVAVVLFIFALLGLIMLWSIFYQFISLFSPRVTLTTGSNNLRFGGRLDLIWSFSMPQLVKKLEFWLDVDEDEKAANVIYEGVCVYRTEDRSLAGRGQVSFQLPETSPQGQFSARLPEESPRPYIQTRKINYVLTLKAKIKFLPNIDQGYRLQLSE